jgi:hypothetical protein
VRGVNFKNFVFELACFGPGLQRVRVTNGTWVDPRGPEWGSVNAVTVSYGDATGTGTQDALVQVDCSVGAGTGLPETLVYSVVNGQLTKIGDIPGTGRFGNSPGTIIVDTPHPAPTDPMCCPSQYERTTYSYDGRIFVSSNNEIVPAPAAVP